MEIEVVINSLQIIEGVEDKQSINCKGIIQKFEKGTVLEFANQEQSFKMTVLKEKILVDRNNQKMIFEIGKITKSALETEYGMIGIEVLTKKIQVKENQNPDLIQKIVLEYEIKLQDTVSYFNQVEIIIR